MKRYRNLKGDAGILSYDYGVDWIRVQFTRGGIYEYTSLGVGVANIREMKRLADLGDGLTTFINTHPRVKNGFTRKIQ